MQVLHIGDVRGIGGLQTWVRELAEAQARRGYDVHIMLPPWAGDAKKDECFTEIPIHVWEPDFVFEFDVVHTHGTAGFYNAHWKRSPNCPAVVHTYYGTTIGIQIAMRWYQNLIGWNGLNTPKGIWMEARSGWGADQVIAVSPKVKREVMRFYRVREAKITIIPGGYTLCAYNTSKQELRRSLGLPEEEFLFLFVGRPDPVKGFEYVMTAFRWVRDKNPSIWLVVAPRDAQSIHDEGVIGISLPPQRMGQLYHACDAFINASLYDAYSLAVHEALAYGLPTVISTGAGIADYCLHGINSLLIHPRPCRALQKALVEAMMMLVDSAPLREYLSANAKRDFGSRTWDWVAEQTERAYEKALSVRGLVKR